MSINDIIDKLETRAIQPGLTLHKGAGEPLLRSVEHAYNITLPDDFREFYRFTDGVEIAEDIFNMIPLAEILENTKSHNDGPFYFAEYMIYSDMWALEINPDNCNDYKIVVRTYQSNKLVLTNSLAEFIDRFLKGGVFEDGGLYSWHDEVESQPIYPTNPTALSIKLLLTVYYYGLKYGLISRKEVIDWSDEIIKSEDEPNHFFIEISLSHHLDELLTIINTMCGPESSASIRAIFGITYHRLLSGAITADAAVAIIDKYTGSALLNASEARGMYELTDEICTPEATIENNELTEKTLEFLASYKEFDLTNYRQWEGLSYRIENNIKGYTGEATYKETAKQSQRRQLYPRIAFYAVAFVAFIFIIPINILNESHTPPTKFSSGLYLASFWFLLFFVYYHFVKGMYWVIMKAAGSMKIKVTAFIATTVFSLFALLVIVADYQLTSNQKNASIFGLKISGQSVWMLNWISAMWLVSSCYEFWKKLRRG